MFWFRIARGLRPQRCFKKSRLLFEPLEERRMLTVTISDSGGGAYIIRGTSSSHDIRIVAPANGDANFDGYVNGLDISTVSSNWRSTGSLGDVNHDGIVSGLDNILISANWLASSQIQIFDGTSQVSGSPINLRSITSISVYGDDGDDTIEIDNNISKPVKVDGEGNGTLKIVGDSNRADNVSMTASTITLANSTVTYANVAAVNLALGSSGSDAVTIDGSSGDDDIVATGNTSLSYGALSITLDNVETLTINGNAGNDTIDATLLSPSIALTINGGAGNDTLVGGAGADTLNGGVGNDSLEGGAGNDALYGGDGNDTYVYSGTFLTGESESLGTDTINENTGEGIDTLDFSRLFTESTHFNMPNPALAGSQSVVSGVLTLSIVRASTVENTIENKHVALEMETNGVYTVYAVHGDETANHIALEIKNGYLGVYDNATSDTSGTLVADTNRSVDSINEIEVYGNDGDDVIYLPTLTTHSVANKPNQFICDELPDLRPADVLVMGAGLTQGTFISAYGGNGNDTIYGTTMPDALWGDEGNDTIHGGDGLDMIYGGNGDDTLYGDDGNDLIYPGAGTDMMFGGNGNDVYYYQSDSMGRDTADDDSGSNSLYVSGIYETGNVGVQVDLRKYGDSSDADSLVTRRDGTPDPAFLFFQVHQNSIENVHGTAMGDILIGNDDANVLQGGMGNDTISGMGGDDVLNGVGGVDTFNYVGDNLGLDRVTVAKSHGDATPFVINVQGTDITMHLDVPDYGFWGAADFELSMDGTTPVISEAAYANYLPLPNIENPVTTTITNVSNLEQPIKYNVGVNTEDFPGGIHVPAALNVVFDAALGNQSSQKWDVVVASPNPHVAKAFFTGTNFLNSLTIDANSTAAINATDSSGALYLNGLTIENDATLDLGTFNLVLDYNGTVSNPSLTNAINSYVTNGMNAIVDTPWIKSSAATPSTTLVATDNYYAHLGDSGSPLDGIDLSGDNFTEVVIRYTFYGDYNLDGAVNDDDYAIVNANLNANLTSTGPSHLDIAQSLWWLYGDGNRDGHVTATPDHDYVRDNYGRSGL